MSPNVQAGMPFCIAPNAWAESSMSQRPFASAHFRISAYGAHCPKRLTAIIPRVFSPISDSILSALTWSVSASMSANFGVPPRRITHSAGAIKVKSGTMTSSPGFSPRASNAIVKASVPLPQVMVCFDPVNSASSDSSAWTTGPPMKQPLSRTSFSAC